MPLYDVECVNGHRAEALLTFAERNELLAQHGDVIVLCQQCGAPARRQLSLPGNMAMQWRRAAHGEST